MNKIGENIKKVRLKNNLTQRQLAKKLNITDKAISKWERGISLPNIEMLKKLSDTLNVNIETFIKSDSKEEQNNILDKQKNIKKENSKIIKKLVYIFIIILLILSFVLYQKVYLGYKLIEVSFPNTSFERTIKLGVPKSTFMMKQNDKSYSFKSIRSKHIIESEIKDYLKTLKYLSCNNTVYYYDEENNFSIINFEVRDNFFYRTISYNLGNGNYCEYKEISELEEVIDIHTIYTMNLGENFYSKDKIIAEFTITDGIGIFDNSTDNTIVGILKIVKLNDPNNENENEIKDYRYIEKNIGKDKLHIFEESTGSIELKDNKVIYYRKNIINTDKELEIPNVLIFNIKNRKLILENNFLDEELILKSVNQ